MNNVYPIFWAPTPPFPPIWGKNWFSETKNDESSKSISSYNFENRAIIFYRYSHYGLAQSSTGRIFDICPPKNLMGDRKFFIFGSQKQSFFNFDHLSNFFRVKYQKSAQLVSSQQICESPAKRIMILSSKL